LSNDEDHAGWSGFLASGEAGVQRCSEGVGFLGNPYTHPDEPAFSVRSQGNKIVAELFAGYREVLAVLPTGNAKTTLAGAIGLYHCQFTADARVPIGASASKQARIVYEQASGFVRRSRELSRRFQVQDGYMRIVAKTAGGLA
jgi:hypothetical protein